jgi:Phosphatidate cytidylyltransferase, mitochondrial
MTAAFDHLLQDFPSVQAAFGYGSGIFKQHSAAGGRHASQPMLDFIFAVRDPQGWHEQVTTACSWYQLSNCWQRVQYPSSCVLTLRSPGYHTAEHQYEPYALLMPGDIGSRRRDW